MERTVDTTLAWSLNPGPCERHVLRQHGNPLFPADRRIVSQGRIDTAREQDAERVHRLQNDFRETLARALGLPDLASMDECKQILDELEGLRTECVAIGGDEVNQWQTEVESATDHIVAAMRESLNGNPERLETFARWREANGPWSGVEKSSGAGD